MAKPTLSEAYQLIKDGYTDDAQDILKGYLRDNGDDPKGWWLYANAGVSDDIRRKSLKRVIKLDPNNDRARTALNRMTDDDDFYVATPASGSQKSSKNSAKKKSNDTLAIAVVVGIGIIGLLVMFVIASVRNNSGSLTVTTGGSGGGASVFSGHDAMWDLVQRGNITVGETKSATVDTFDDDGWVLTVSESASVQIDVIATSSDLDPQLYVYDGNGNLVAENDDIDFMENTDSRLNLRLPAGSYGVVVSAFGSGGSYRVSVR